MMPRGLPRTSVLDGAPTARDIEPATSPIPLPVEPPTDPLPAIAGQHPGLLAAAPFDDDRHTRQAAVLAAFLGLIMLVALLMGLGLI